MADDIDDKENKFDFTADGEALGYISLAQARLMAMQTARETPCEYGGRFRDASMAFEIAESSEDEVPRREVAGRVQAAVHIALDDGRGFALQPGDLIGRMAGAALSLNDGRISEAHALISLRGGALRLLALRGLFTVDDQLVAAVTLVPGLRVELAPGLAFTVAGLALPDRVAALSGEGLNLQALTSLSSLLLDPDPRISPRYEPDAAAVLWSRGDGWRLQPAGEETRPLGEGEPFEVGGRRFVLGSMPLAHAGPGITERTEARPLTIRFAGSAVELRRGDGASVTLRGNGAHLIRELVEFAGPVDWYTLARQVWPDGPCVDRTRLRARLDTTLKRVRARLRDGGVGAGVLVFTQTGQVELLSQPGDRIVEGA